MGFIKTQICKFAVIFTLIFGANVAFAEESGGFLGLGVGYSDLNLTVKGRYDFDSTTSTESTKTATGEGVAYGAIIGYKQLFNPYVGLRYYVNVDAMHSKVEYNGAKSREMIFLNYNANMDLLVNFLGNKDNDFGLFLGFGLGANTLLGKGAKDMTEDFKAKKSRRQARNYELWRSAKCWDSCDFSTISRHRSHRKNPNTNSNV